jgi:transposase
LAEVRERILLVRCVRADYKEVPSIAENEFHRSRWWAYKWLKRFDKSGLEALKDLRRSGGRPPEVSEEIFSEIRSELSENPTGWKAKEIMNISSTNVQVSDTMKSMCIDYYTNGVSGLKYHKEDLSILHLKKKRKNISKKRLRK